MTSANSLLFRMNQGIPGDITRQGFSQVEAQIFGATAFPAYGLPAKISAGTVIPVAANNDKVYGFLVRPFPITGANASDPLGTSVPPTSGVANVMTRGYITVNVQLGSGSVAAGSQVFVRYQNPSGGQIVGGVEGATSGNNYVLTNARFTGNVDASGNAEIYLDNGGTNV